MLEEVIDFEQQFTLFLLFLVLLLPVLGEIVNFQLGVLLKIKLFAGR